MATVPTSSAGSMIFTQSEATAAQRTWVFHMTLAATGADFTGAAGIAMTISKAGGAFAAVDAGTVITELTNGWYKVVHAAADLDTLGCLGVRVVGTLADTLNVTHQVSALDTNVATVNPGTGGIVAASFSTDALAAISVPLKPVQFIATLTADGDTAISMQGAIDAIVEVTGTFGSGTVQMQTTEDPTAGSPVWTNRGSGITTSNAASPLTVTGPHNAIRAHLTGSTAPSIQLKITQRKPAV
ncbi:MAG TPA: hypothetical protein VIV56_12140 [Gemmatimonadales bacterium]